MMPYDSQSGTNPNGSSSADSQKRMQLENRLRVKKIEVSDRERHLHDIERDMVRLENELEHVRADLKRTENEEHSMVSTLKKDEGITKQAEQGIREKDQELHRRSDATLKIEHEIAALKQQIEVKEREMREIKEETRELMKQKEEFRRQYELEHYSAKMGGEHVHEKDLRIQRFRQEEARKEGEIAHKKQEHARLKQDIMFHTQEVSQIEAELRHV